MFQGNQRSRQKEKFKQSARAALLCGVVLSILSVLAAACKQRNFNSPFSLESELAEVDEVKVNREELLAQWRFERITPTGEKLLAAAIAWQQAQEPEAGIFAKPGQSANNLSRVFEMAGITQYSSPVLADIVESIRKQGGLVAELPKEKRAIARLIAENFNGVLPAGALISGCLRRDCSGDTADGHIALIGHTDANDQLHLWHNNWFRPENRPWREHMIPLTWYQAGWRRKWMSTPWMHARRTEAGFLSDLEILMPDIDDLDPTNYYVILSVLPEMMSELKKGSAVTSDGRGGVMPFSVRSASRTSTALPLPPVPPLSRCQKLKTISPTPTLLRSEPNEKVLCKLPIGTPLERVGSQGNWTKVKTTCPDGLLNTGVVLSALAVPACEK